MKVEEIELQTLKFPVGKFKVPEAYTNELIHDSKLVIVNFMNVLEPKVKGLTEEQLSWRYRPNGWTIKQVIHHFADSHMNAFIRFKLALTEDVPIIKPYVEAAWAELPDSLDNEVEDSLMILRGLHKRFAKLLENLDAVDLDRKFTHPDWNKDLPLKMNICLYAWHCRHHLAHIDNALRSRGIYNKL